MSTRSDRAVRRSSSSLAAAEAGVRLECDIGQCIPPPKAERLVECLERLVQLVRGHRGACSVETLDEARGVHVARVTLDDVPGCTGDDDRGLTERAPEA